MTTALGKRKRPEPEGVKASVAVPEAEIDVQAIFQRHFEARFRPLKTASQALGTPARGIEGQGEASSEESGSESSSESGWGGISDDEEKEDAVEIIDHSAQAPAPSLSTMTKHELKAFMSSRPPQPSDLTSTTAATPADGSGDSDSDSDSAARLLANDLALQRLLAESHLLSAAGANPALAMASHTSSSVTVRATTALDANSRRTSRRGRADFSAGRTRAAQTALRLRLLGAGAAAEEKQRMPMVMRRGIALAAAEREVRRRREARESGVVLEREVDASATKKRKTRREALVATERSRRKREGGGRAAVDLPGVGRMRGAELRLSQRDVRSIEGAAGGPGLGRGRGRGPGQRRRRR